MLHAATARYKYSVQSKNKVLGQKKYIHARLRYAPARSLYLRALWAMSRFDNKINNTLDTPKCTTRIDLATQVAERKETDEQAGTK
jgi:hypothetical protein